MIVPNWKGFHLTLFSFSALSLSRPANPSLGDYMKLSRCTEKAVVGGSGVRMDLKLEIEYRNWVISDG